MADIDTLVADLAALELNEQRPNDTYLDNYKRVWIGLKWDVAEDSQGHYVIFRKGNYKLTVGTLDLAVAIVRDNEGFPK